LRSRAFDWDVEILPLLLSFPSLLFHSGRPLAHAEEAIPIPPAPIGDPISLGPTPPAGEKAPLSELSPPEADQAVKPTLPAARLTQQEVNAVEYVGGPLPDGVSALTLKLQIILDQTGMSPGVIDGVNGKNVAKAIAGVEVLTGQPVDGVLDEEVWRRLPHDTPILVDYEITGEDVTGPFLPEVPSDFAEMAKLDRLSYTSPLEMLGERFHMDVDLLKGSIPTLISIAPAPTS